MRALILTLAIGLTTAHAYAQKPPVKFGDVSTDEVKMTRFDKDTSATAVILADYGESVISYNQQTGFQLEFSRITRIKILKKDGYEWADFEVPVYTNGSDKEKVTNLKGITYNVANGKVEETKLKNDGVFDEEVSKNLTLVKFTMPNVKEGSVVEVSYKVYSDFFWEMRDWTFQDEIPTVFSEYRVRTPEYFHYDRYMQGYITLAANEHETAPSSITLTGSTRSSSFSGTGSFYSDKIDFTEDRYRWVAKDVPAFVSEPYITTYRDYVSKINFELAYIKMPNEPIKPVLGTWEQINKAFYESESIGTEVRGNGFLKKIAEDAIAGASTPEEKISAIVHYVKSNVSWDGRTTYYTSNSLRKVLDSHKGSTGEINLLLASMLEKAGFDVVPVVLSTRDHGFIRENIPISSQFNNVVCLVRVGDGSVLLDASDKYLPIGVLPERCLNGRGFAIAKDAGRWVPLLSPLKTRTYIASDLVLSPDGELKGKLDFERMGYDAVSCRKTYFSKGETDYIKGVHEGKNWELTKTAFQNTEEIQQPFKESHELTINEHATAAGDVIYINPFVTGRITENPFKLENREYPVDFGRPYEVTVVTKIGIPEGYVIEEMPPSKVYMMADKSGRYIYNLTQVGNTITFTSSLTINSALYTQVEYPNLREFFNQVVAKQNEQIVLKKQ